MEVVLKKDNKGRFGFVEEYKPYTTGLNDAVRIKATAKSFKYFNEAYVYRAGEFIRTSQIDKEMGIDKYIKAKKPIYSLIDRSSVIIIGRVAIGNNNEVNKDRSFINMYSLGSNYIVGEDGRYILPIHRIDINQDRINEWLDSLMKKTASYGINREAFLKSRFTEDETEGKEELEEEPEQEEYSDEYSEEE